MTASSRLAHCTARQVSVIARTRMRYFLALGLVCLAAAWAEATTAPVRAVAPLNVEIAPDETSRRADAPPPRTGQLADYIAGPLAERIAGPLAERITGPISDQIAGPLAKVAQRTPADLVVVVSIDGLRPDVITPSHEVAAPAVPAGLERARRAHHQQVGHAAFARIDGQRRRRGASTASTSTPIAPSAATSVARPCSRSRTRPGLPTYMFVGKAKLKHLLGKPSDAAAQGGRRRLQAPDQGGPAAAAAA